MPPSVTCRPRYMWVFEGVRSQAWQGALPRWGASFAASSTRSSAAGTWTLAGDLLMNARGLALKSIIASLVAHGVSRVSTRGGAEYSKHRATSSKA
jgi:hypothetical protein